MKRLEEDFPAAASDARTWTRIFANYRDPRPSRSILELLITAGPLTVIAVLACWALAQGYWWAMILTAPAGGLVVRMFMIQHDCGHGAFFKSRQANDWVGRIIGVITLTPYDYWKRTHAIHHATSGNLDRRELGAIETLTVAEYRALPRFRRLLYRLYRHPLVLFGVGPAYMFFLQQRIPIGLMKGPSAWVSVMGANIGIAILVAGGVFAFGAGPFLAFYIPTITLAAMIGVWLFYVQHQFDRTHWAPGDSWDLHEAALHGSSHYDLPAVLRWFTANIGVHHVHHLNSRIPFYRLSEVLRDHPQLKDFGRLTLADSFRCVPLALWDEAGRRLVSFRAIRAQ